MERQERLGFFRHLQEFTRVTLLCWLCWPQCLVYPSKRSSSRSGKGSSPQKRSRSPSSSPEGRQKRSRSRSSSGGRKRRRSRSCSSERFGFLWNTTLPLIVDSFPHYQPNAPSLVNLIRRGCCSFFLLHVWSSALTAQLTCFFPVVCHVISGPRASHPDPPVLAPAQKRNNSITVF